MHQYSALISQSMLPQSLKLQLKSKVPEDAHSCDRFSNLVSNALGLSHLPIIYVQQAIFEHELILIDASFVVLRRGWPLFAEPNRKQGQPVVMSKFKLMESFISYTSVCPIFRRAKCYHAFGTAQSYPRQVSKTLADGCFNHENRYISSFQLLFHCLHVLNNPQSSTHEALDSLTMSHLFKANSIPKTTHWITSKLCFWGKRLITVEAPAQQQVSLLWRRLRTGSAAKRQPETHWGFEWWVNVGKDKYNALKYPKSWINGAIRNKAVLVWRRKWFSRDNVVMGCYGSVRTKLAGLDWFSYPQHMTISFDPSPRSWVPHRSHVSRGSWCLAARRTSCTARWIWRWMDLKVAPFRVDVEGSAEWTWLGEYPQPGTSMYWWSFYKLRRGEPRRNQGLQGLYPPIQSSKTKLQPFMSDNAQGTRLSLHPHKMMFNALPKKNQHHLISQFDNRFGVTSLGTTGQI